MKRILSKITVILLTVIMCVGMFPLSAFAAAGGYDDSNG
jgi:hypothetical protein